MTLSATARVGRLPGRWPRTLGQRILLAFLMVGLLALGNILVVRTLLQESAHTAATVNLAGRMRMLSQRIALQALAERVAGKQAGNALQQELAVFEASYRDLLASPAIPPQQDARLAAVQHDWQALRAATAVFAATPADPAPLLAASNQLLGSAEALMGALLQRTAQMQQRAMLSAYTLFALDLLLLALAYALMARHVMQPVHRLIQQCRALATGQFAARSGLASADELGELGRSLDESAAHIEQLIVQLGRERLQLEQAKAMFDGLSDNSLAGIYMLDRELRLTYANEQFAQLAGHDGAETMRGLPLASLFTAQEYAAVQAQLQLRFDGHARNTRYECTARRRDGSAIEIEVFGSVMLLDGAPAIIGIMLDISERKRAEASARRAALVCEHISEALAVTDADGFVLDVNPAFSAITGYAPHDIIGQRMSRLSSGQHDRSFYAGMWQSLRDTGHWSGDIRNRHKAGHEFVERLTINTAYNDDGSISCRIGLFADVTEARRREATIWHQAHFDHLTQLPNRQMFHEKLRQSIAQAADSGLAFALIFLDLDLFKEVNDTFGHDEGDELLRLVARRLGGCVRSGDLVARLGGDEFTVIVRELAHPDDVLPICRNILEQVAQPYPLKSNTVHISASLGITSYPRDGGSGSELLKQADLAMYAAKEKGRNQYCVFSPAMHASMLSRRTLLRELQQALDTAQFTLHYQPIVEMRSGLTVKAEALIRWQHPERGLVGPGEFIALAEDTGLIVPIGDWAFREATAQVAQWRRGPAKGFQVGINVSPAQFQPGGLDPQAWIGHLRQLALPGAAVSIEITERQLMDAKADSGDQLKAFRDIGMQVALDDFGTGYSSLTYLKRFDADYLKIDQSFVRHLKRDSEDMVLCQAIIAMAHQLGIKVIAEGIETLVQHELLRSAGCDYGQGYWYSRALPAEQLASRLQQEHALDPTLRLPRGVPG